MENILFALRKVVLCAALSEVKELEIAIHARSCMLPHCAYELVSAKLTGVCGVCGVCRHIWIFSGVLLHARNPKRMAELIVA